METNKSFLNAPLSAKIGHVSPMENNLKYFIFTFGCQMNKADSERIAALLEKTGYEPAENEKDADLIVANMCSVRQSAVDRVLGFGKLFPELKAKNPNLKTVLTGCVLIEDFKKSGKLFDYVLPIKRLAKWPEYLKEENFSMPSDPFQKDCAYLELPPKHSSKVSVYIPISNGCNNFCAYCAVPYTRGPLVCRDFKDILIEAEQAVKNGAKEIWLLGQNVNDYFCDGVSFAKLIEVINDIPGDFWIRFASPHPQNFYDEMITAVSRCKKVAPYISLPLQAGDDDTLKKMNRPYKVGGYRVLVNKLRKAFSSQRQGLEKELALSTDVIVGFPGESKHQFNNTARLMDEIKYDMAYIAQYSPRPGTHAARIPDNVSKVEKEKRWEHLTEILKKTALNKNKLFVGNTVEVLVDEQREGFLLGKSRHFKTVKIKIGKEAAEKNFIGQFVKADITEALPWGLEGELR